MEWETNNNVKQERKKNIENESKIEDNVIGANSSIITTQKTVLRDRINRLKICFFLERLT